MIRWKSKGLSPFLFDCKTTIAVAVFFIALADLVAAPFMCKGFDCASV
nr:MAG TPA: hypothetical protein [Caudoviricetes sp.]